MFHIHALNNNIWKNIFYWCAFLGLLHRWVTYDKICFTDGHLLVYYIVHINQKHSCADWNSHTCISCILVPKAQQDLTPQYQMWNCNLVTARVKSHWLFPPEYQVLVFVSADFVTSPLITHSLLSSMDLWQPWPT
jgi:hypothetical protein